MRIEFPDMSHMKTEMRKVDPIKIEMNARFISKMAEKIVHEIPGFKTIRKLTNRAVNLIQGI